MQSINVVVINPWFLTPFLGTAVLCVLVTISSLMRWHDPRVLYWLAGSVLYFAGTFLVTMLFNVPRNNALAVVAQPGSRQVVGLVSLHLDDLESRANDSRARGRGVIHDRIPPSSLVESAGISWNCCRF